MKTLIEIHALQNFAPSNLNRDDTGAPKDAWFGVGAMDDWPTGSYGSSNCYGGPDDQPFILLQSMTDDVMKAQNGVQQLLRGSSPRGCGADTPEGQMPGLYAIATGDAIMGAGANVPANHKGIGGVEFSDGALPVVVAISDASFHSKGDAAPLTCFGDRSVDSAISAITSRQRRGWGVLRKLTLTRRPSIPETSSFTLRFATVLMISASLSPSVRTTLSRNARSGVLRNRNFAISTRSETTPVFKTARSPDSRCRMPVRRTTAASSGGNRLTRLSIRDA